MHEQNPGSPRDALRLSPMRRAILAMEKVEAKLSARERAEREPLAVIGMGCRFPGGAATPEDFWRLLERGGDAVTEVPADRWSVDPALEGSASASDRRAVRWGAFLPDVDRFDPQFFGISIREARSLDPQQRILLEVAWEALERAGQIPERLWGKRAGVFIGVTTNDYMDLCAGVELDAFMGTGNGHCFTAGRLSYVLGLEGPSLAVDTACSSSLVAIHLACQSLRNGESALALACGINLMLSPSITHMLAKMHALSPGGRCKAFDAQADGIVRGEGCGVVVLKRLSDAQADGDPILALIRGSAVNQDGRSNGLTAPNVRAQQALLRQALENGRTAASDIGYVETHGTGTPLGDPIETEALAEVLGAPRTDGSVCVLGAVKTNLGHLEAAAGIAGLIKAVLCLQQEVIPPNLHFTMLNPRIALEGTALVVPTESVPWKTGGKTRLAGVSAFGMSGTNAHVILEEAPRGASPEPSWQGSTLVLPLSAKSPEALFALAQTYRSFLARPPSEAAEDLGNIAFTAGVRRGHHPFRIALAGRSRQDWIASLDAFLRGDVHPGLEQGALKAGTAGRLLFVFSGHGPFPLGAGRALLTHEPVFRRAIGRCDAVFQQVAGVSVQDAISADEGSVRLREPGVADAVWFAVHAALAELWRSWGVVPDAVIGHGASEVTAAYVAGALTLEEAARLIHAVGRAASSGAPLMSAEALEGALGRLHPQRTQIMMYSTVTGAYAEGRDLDAAYWVRTLQRPTAFARALETAIADGHRVALDVGDVGPPDSVVAGELLRCFGERGEEGRVLSSLRPALLAIEPRQALAAALGALYAMGYPVEWKAVYASVGKCVPLPTYPWQRERYWVDRDRAPAPRPPVGIGSEAGASGVRRAVEPTPARDPRRASAEPHDAASRDVAIAIVGAAGRFPGAPSLEQFWDNLRRGASSVRFFRDEELVAAGIPSSMLRDPRYVKAGGELEEADRFDAAFFGVPPDEARAIDPQQRLFLECSGAALEDAGYDVERYHGRIGVFAGAGMNTYGMARGLGLPFGSGPFTLSSLQALAANDKDALTTRVSTKLGLKGPSITVQTGSSTALVAVHLACQSLLNHECEMALAGSASVVVPQNIGYLHDEGGMLSPDGRCRAFDAQARGTVPGNGVGVVVLKRLSDALADGDVIHAVVKGSAIHNDGAARGSLAAERGEGQARAIAEAFTRARVDPSTLAYVECVGSGREHDDRIEIAALTRAYRSCTETSGAGRCAVGSVATNIGHLYAAAGMAGLLKTVLALRHRSIPPSLHCTQPNPRIDFSSTPFFVNTELRDWSLQGTPRRAGVSAFDVGGTNAHVVLEEAPQPAAAPVAAKPHQLLLISAKTKTALDAATAQLAGHLDRRSSSDDLADVAYTLQVGRRTFAHRRIVVCNSSDRNDAVQALQRQPPERVRTGVREAAARRPLVFLLPGQGAQFPNMGLDLYRTEPVFRREVDVCAQRLRPELDLDLRDVLFPGPSQEAEAAEALQQTHLTQVALFTVEYALCKLWQAWGIAPSAMIGHSIGEYVAAAFAGVFSLEDALALIAARGRLMQTLEPGAMLAVSLPEEALQPRLGAHVSIAAVNGPALCVASGPEDAIEALRQSLAQEDVFARRLHVTRAFHSTMVTPILQPFKERFRGIQLHPPKIPFVSNVTGTWIQPDEAMNPGYWARHLRHAVRFSDGLLACMAEGDAIFLEAGPGQTLSELVRRHPGKSGGHAVIASMRHAREVHNGTERVPDDLVLLRALGQLWIEGISPDWERFHGQGRRRCPLPTYPFERAPFWVPPAARAPEAGDDHAAMEPASETAMMPTLNNMLVKIL